MNMMSEPETKEPERAREPRSNREVQRGAKVRLFPLILSPTLLVRVPTLPFIVTPTNSDL